MRSLFTFFILLSTFSALSQDITVPYRSGNKYGLSDGKGKMIIQPTYDHLEWLSDHYFITGIKVEIHDTIETTPLHFLVRNRPTYVTGLIYQDKVVLQNEPYTDYKIIPGACIIAKMDEHPEKLLKEHYIKMKKKEKYVSLLNITGKNVYPDNFKRLQRNDTLNVVLQNKKTARFVLFYAEQLDKKYSIFIYDVQKQTISNWLVQNAFKIKDHFADLDFKLIRLEYEDSAHNNIIQLVDYRNGQFIVYGPGGKPISEYKKPELPKSEEADISISPVEFVSAAEETPFDAYYQGKADSLFYVFSKQKKAYIDMSPGTDIIYADDLIKRQAQPVIYKEGNKYGLLIRSSLSETVYDSLFYFGKYYIAAKKISGQLKWGILNAEGKETIPLTYDSLDVVKQYALTDGNNNKKRTYYLKDKNSSPFYSNYSRFNIKNNDDRIIIYKNGKMGMTDLYNNVIIPANYDTIAENGPDYGDNKVWNYLILKNDGKYGIVELEKNKNLGKYEVTKVLNPVFKGIPSFYFKDYYGIKNQKLYSLDNEEGKFLGYTAESGLLFYSEQ